jgi:thiamine-monophosphate kinase
MIPLGPGNEFDAIREMLHRWGPRASGIGDDAALLQIPADHRLVISTDASIENQHFRRAWLSPKEIGYRATAAALSDLAAMAAHPIALLVAIAAPPSWRESLGEIAEGIGEAASGAGAQIVGGDTSAGSELNLTITVLGIAQNPLGRQGARPGNRIYVTGELGASISALRVLQRGGRPTPEHFHRFAHPVPRIREAQWLAGNGATAAIDISDGVLADVSHLAAAGNVRIHLDLEALPAAAQVDPRHAAQSGEEYELAVAAPDNLDREAFQREFGIRLTPVGSVTEGAAGLVAIYQGNPVDLIAGYDHFHQ